MNHEIYQQISGCVYSTPETQRSSYEIGAYLKSNNIQGDIVELGVAAAGNFGTILLGCKDINWPVKGWGFDSFEGIQLAGKKDTLQAGIGEITHNTDVPYEDLLVSSGITIHSKQSVIDNLTNWGLYENVELIEGWVQNTLPVHASRIDKISVLRLDMDIYHPTKISLEYLWDKVVEGGLIIIDDWALDGARLACQEFFQERNLNPEIQTIPNSTPVYFIKTKEMAHPYYSQNDEEKYIVDYFTSKGKVVGNFVDIGAFHPTALSNTRKLYEMGWCGVFIEPSPKCFSTFVEEYSWDEKITLLPYAIGPRDGKITFYESNGDAVSTSSIDHKVKWEMGSAVTFDKIEVEMMAAHRFETEHGMDIDFLSLDVEGTNWEIFNLLSDAFLTRLKMICIEHDNRNHDIMGRLEPLGFVQIALNGENLIAAKP